MSVPNTLSSQEEHIDPAIKESFNVGPDEDHLFSGSEDNHNLDVSGDIISTFFNSDLNSVMK